MELEEIRKLKAGDCLIETPFKDRLSVSVAVVVKTVQILKSAQHLIVHYYGVDYFRIYMRTFHPLGQFTLKEGFTCIPKKEVMPLVSMYINIFYDAISIVKTAERSTQPFWGEKMVKMYKHATGEYTIATYYDSTDVPSVAFFSISNCELTFDVVKYKEWKQPKAKAYYVRYKVFYQLRVLYHNKMSDLRAKFFAIAEKHATRLGDSEKNV